MPSLPKSALSLVAAAGVAVAALQSGCSYTEQGPGMSIDQFTYVSRSWQPWTITLKDTRTGQEIWSMDVPVGKQLTLKFTPKGGTEGQYTPDVMTWSLMDEGSESTFLSNSLPVPPASDRLLEPTLRPVPELPESMIAATRGAVQPAKRPTVKTATSPE